MQALRPSLSSALLNALLVRASLPQKLQVTPISSSSKSAREAYLIHHRSFVLKME
jgi:hypothetical protein